MGSDYQTFEEKLHHFISLHAIDKLLVAYSGGVDSELLAFFLSVWKKKNNHIDCLLLHVNHHISPQATQWENHCIQNAKKYQLAIEIEQAYFHDHNNFEQKARKVRYRFFNRFMSKNTLLMTAHHNDDQIENFFLALKRGSGALGLSGMKEIKEYHSGWLFRPFLSLNKSTIIALAQQYQLYYVSDESNQDVYYDRNFIRHHIIPMCNQRWTAFNACVTRSMLLLAEQQALCDEMALFDYNACVDDNRLQLSYLRTLSEKRLFNVVRYWLRLNDILPPSLAQIHEIKQVFTIRQDAKVQVAFHDISIRRYQDYLYIVTKSQPVKIKEEKFVLGAENKLANGQIWKIEHKKEGKRLKLIKDNMTVIYGLSSSTKLHPDYRNMRREVKKICQELSIPPWERQYIPFLCHQGEILAAIGYWYEKTALVEQGEGLALVHIK